MMGRTYTLERTVEVAPDIDTADYEVRTGQIAILRDANYSAKPVELRGRTAYIVGRVGKHRLDISIEKRRVKDRRFRVCKIISDAPGDIAQRTLDAITLYYCIAQSEEESP